jgi:hypothetical protein
MMSVSTLSLPERSSGQIKGMFVLVDDAAEAVASVDVQAGEPVQFGDRCGQRRAWPDAVDALMRAMLVVEGFALA